MMFQKEKFGSKAILDLDSDDSEYLEANKVKAL
jgi:hypothetical protein